jgi:hypothetical protein
LAMADQNPARRLRRRAGELLGALWHLDGLLVGGLVAAIAIVGGKREVPIVWRVVMLVIPTLLLVAVGYLVVFRVG